MIDFQLPVSCWSRKLKGRNQRRLGVDFRKDQYLIWAQEQRLAADLRRPNILSGHMDKDYQLISEISMSCLGARVSSL